MERCFQLTLIVETSKILLDPVIVRSPWKKEADGSEERLKPRSSQYPQTTLHTWVKNKECFLTRWRKGPEQEGLKETSKVISGAQGGGFITAYFLFVCPLPSQRDSRDTGLFLLAVGVLDLRRQGGVLGSNDSLERGWVPTHKTDCPLLCPWSEPTFFHDP